MAAEAFEMRPQEARLLPSSPRSSEKAREQPSLWTAPLTAFDFYRQQNGFLSARTLRAFPSSLILMSRADAEEGIHKDENYL